MKIGERNEPKWVRRQLIWGVATWSCCCTGQLPHATGRCSGVDKPGQRQIGVACHTARQRLLAAALECVCVCQCVRWRATWSSSLLATQIEYDEESRWRRARAGQAVDPSPTPTPKSCLCCRAMRNFINPIRRLHVAVLWGILCVPRLAAGRWQMPSSQVPPPPTCGVARLTSTQVAASLCFLLKKFLISLGASRRVKRGATWNQVRGVANLLNAPLPVLSLLWLFSVPLFRS